MDLLETRVEFIDLTTKVIGGENRKMNSQWHPWNSMKRCSRFNSQSTRRMRTRLLVYSLFAICAVTFSTFAQTTPTRRLTVVPDPSIIKEPSGAAKAGALLDPADTIVLLLDHQTGLFQTVKDVPVRDLRANTVVLAKAAELAKVPVITTASEPNGPNGPLMPELAQAAPSATYVPRKGEISAWDNEDFKRIVKESGRKTLVMAGVWTSVCVAFPALQAKAEGYKVYAVMDASGDMSEMASQTTLARMTQAGIIPVTVNVVVCELQRTWARPDAAAYGALYHDLVPNYRAVAESYQKAQEAAKSQPGKDVK
ncbi:MAG: putative amidohydrolase [Verrucomicrobiales bacterium]|nr:putative amidohydrolase [Verrucomicrobiales bacterium]